MQDLTTREPCIGVVAGAGPDAGVTFWRQVLAASRWRQGETYRGDLDAPRVRVISEPTLGYVTDLDANRGRLQKTLSDILSELHATCHTIVVACHALQGLAKDVASDEIGQKLVLLPDVVCDFVRKEDIRSVGLLGAPSISASAERSPYRALWHVAEVEKPKDPDAVMALILEAKRIGASHPRVLKQLSSMISAYEADTVLLACTDFSGLDLTVDGKTIVDVLELAADVVTAAN
ncbi:aspartate/glutamate racemase family protein [Mesorhizobium sp. CO1-1-8]|uniref:aspartate/glutamate racemase family protein n=1 Tax=Mesorhizobium sp. CO1-1-8 TaxID=2876631 RepID=UPI001CD113B1|nr:aspartate/glutamate racemase family protein [Mesorhizobium sp. CO1-1-8]MBZ9772491.1 hypothetical protein [Mesorhizobium sp. CO1-1-8]